MSEFRNFFMQMIIGIFLILTLSGFSWTDLWATKDQQAEKLFLKKDFEKAAKTFRSPQWQAAANYRTGNYQNAIEGYKNDPSAEGFYNLGNAMAKSGQLEEALFAYNKALKLQSDFPDAEFNRALIEKLLEKNKQDQKKQENKESQENKDQQQSDNSEGSKKNQQASQNDEKNDSQSDQDKQQKQAENKQSDQSKGDDQKNQKAENKRPQVVDTKSVSLSEKEQADKQWLQQIDDDPGGLLRRKFLRDHQRRIKGG